MEVCRVRLVEERASNDQSTGVSSSSTRSAEKAENSMAPTREAGLKVSSASITALLFGNLRPELLGKRLAQSLAVSDSAYTNLRPGPSKGSRSKSHRVGFLTAKIFFS